MSAEIVKNMLMAVPTVSYLRKRRYAIQNDPVDELRRQETLCWRVYTSSLVNVNLDKFILGAKVLEVGPGPILGNAIRFIASGAVLYLGIERYPLFRTDRSVRRAYRDLIMGFEAEQQKRCLTLVCPDGQESLFDERVQVKVITLEQASEAFSPGSFDLIVSFNVMEHIDDLESALVNMYHLLRQGGLMIHRVDVGTHTDRSEIHPLWQLTVPDHLWHAMYSRRAYPNRRRPSEYLRLAEQVGLKTVSYEVTNSLPEVEVEKMRPRLQSRFRSCLLGDLAILDFVWVTQK